MLVLVPTCRCVVQRTKRPLKLMTEDHRPTEQNERDRIEEAGGFVIYGRVDGALDVSRALGDIRFKQVTYPYWPVISGAS